MRRHTLLALSLAAGLALPVGFSTAALAITEDDRANLASASTISPSAMQAAVTAVLQNLVADQSLNAAVDELAGILLDLGVTDQFKAKFAQTLVVAAQELAAAGAIEGVDAATAGETAAEAVLVQAQGSPTLLSAIFAEASAPAATDPTGLAGGTVFDAFVAASTSPLIDTANQNAVRGAVMAVPTTASVGNVASNQFGNGGAGGGPNSGGMTVTNNRISSAGGGGGDGSTTGAGGTVSPN